MRRRGTALVFALVMLTSAVAMPLAAAGAAPSASPPDDAGNQGPPGDGDGPGSDSGNGPPAEPPGNGDGPPQDVPANVSAPLWHEIHDGGTESGAAADEPVTVTVVAEDGQLDGVRSSVVAAGGSVLEEAYGSHVLAELPATGVTEVAADSRTRIVREPAEAVELQTGSVSEGVDVMGVDALHQSGIEGEDATVAVVDHQFNPANPKIEDQVVDNRSFDAANNFANPFNEGAQGRHGTASAEVVADVAPEADLVLVSVSTVVDFENAVEWIETDTDADVVTMSLGWYPTVNGGPLDGDDVISQEVADSSDELLWTTSAGNQGEYGPTGLHWHGDWTDNDFPSTANNEEIDFQNLANPGTRGTLFVSWDDPNLDHELRVETDNCGVLTAGPNPDPVVAQAVGAGCGDGNLTLERVGGPANADADFDVHAVGGLFLDEYTVNRSLLIPAVSDAPITVGAVDHTDDRLASYSSRGPTIDGRQGIDVVAPTNVSQVERNSFTGTSAAAPHVGGLAGLIAGEGDVEPRAIRRLIEANTRGISGDRTNLVTDTSPTSIGEGHVEQPRPDLRIVDVNGQAGSFETPRHVSVEVDAQTAAAVEADRFDVTVGGEQVDDVAVLPVFNPGLPPTIDHRLTFVPPEQDSAGAYDLQIEYAGLLGEDFPAVAEREDAITYAETSQVAASLQIDRSGSMGGTMDEARRGATTFVQQANDDDYVSVTSYSSGSRVDHELVQLQDNRDDVTGAIQGIRSGGSTNVGAAMDDGLQTLEDAPEGTRRAGVHMTDGNRNAGPSEDEILNEIVPTYNERGVCLYTIGFTSGADEEFMQEVADASDCGFYEFAAEQGEVDSAEETLRNVFADIQTDVAAADIIDRIIELLPGGETFTRSFSVDDSVFQTTVNVRLEGADLSGVSTTDSADADVASTDAADATAPVTLHQPDGTVVNASDDDVDVSVVGDSVIYRIEEPEAGEWSYQAHNARNETAELDARVTALSQTSLSVDTAADTYYEGGTAELQATLVGPDGAVGDADVTATVETPGGETLNATLAEAATGVYTGSVDVDQAGTYRATVTAQTDELTRVATREWSVESSPPLTVTQSEVPVVLRGATGSVDLTVNRTGASDSTPVAVDVSDLSANDGDGTIPRSAIDVSPRTLTLQGDEARTVTATISVPGDAAGGTYEGVVRVVREDGSVVTGTVEVTVLAEQCVDLVAGQRHEAGDVCVVHDDEHVEVTYETTEAWTLQETHLAVGESLDAYRAAGWLNPADNPRPGQFPYADEHGAGTDEVTYTVPAEALDLEGTEDLVVAAHAEVDGEHGSEGAWADGEQFRERGNWATYAEYELEAGA